MSRRMEITICLFCKARVTKTSAWIRTANSATQFVSTVYPSEKHALHTGRRELVLVLCQFFPNVITEGLQVAVCSLGRRSVGRRRRSR
jgi:hypothetical protein